MRPCRRSARRSFLCARPRDHVSAALDQGGVDHLHADGGVDAGRHRHTRGLRRGDGRAAADRWHQPAEDGYLRDLCEKVSGRSVDLESLEALSDEEVIAALVTVKGIGRWSAEMFLIFRLLRPDVLPVGDLGSSPRCSGPIGCASGRRRIGMRKIGEAWRPYRSVASWYLWRSLDNEP